MKVALGSKIIEGPWGGGNNFIKNFSNFLKKKDCEVYHELKIKDLDIILLTDPREKSKSASFNHFDVFRESSMSKKRKTQSEGTISSVCVEHP